VINHKLSGIDALRVCVTWCILVNIVYHKITWHSMCHLYCQHEQSLALRSCVYQWTTIQKSAIVLYQTVFILVDLNLHLKCIWSYIYTFNKAVYIFQFVFGLHTNVKYELPL